MNAPKNNTPAALAGANRGKQTLDRDLRANTVSRGSGIPLTNREFIIRAFRNGAEDEFPWVTGFPGDPGSVDHALWGRCSALPLPRFIHAGNNNYIAVSSFRQGDDGRPRRRKACFAAMHVVMIDDVVTKVPPERITLPPTCVVETSPGNYQAWYFLTEPERDRLRAENLIKGMIASGLTKDGADPGMNGVTRYGRLPVGINGKAKYRDEAGEPFVQRVASWDPTVRYSLDEIAIAYNVDLSAVSRPKRIASRRARPLRDSDGNPDGFLHVFQEANLYLEPLDGMEGAHRVICPWVREHTDEDPTGTAYFEPSSENAWVGGFKCHHGHCQHRTIADLTHFVARLLQLHPRIENHHAK